MSRKILYPAIALVAAQSAGFAANTGQAGAFQPHNPVVFARPFPVVEQQFQALPNNRPPRPVDAQFLRAQPPELFKQPFAAALQQWSAFQPAGFVRSTFPDGWRGWQWDTRFAKPFPAGEQQFTTYFKLPDAITPQGWYPQPPDIFKRPFPISEQPYTTAPEPENFPPGLGWWGWQFDYKFAKPFPAALQQFSAFQPEGFIPPFFPPGAGKYPKIPSYVPQPDYEGKPNKPFRPVWDKPREGAVEQPAPKAPSGPPPRPPAAIFGTPGQAGDAKVNAPPALNLPSFDQYGVADAAGFGDRMRESQDMSDAIAVLKKLGLLPNS